jgi:hypothetical protein
MAWTSASFAGDKVTGLDTFFQGFGGSGYANDSTEYSGSNGTVTNVRHLQARAVAADAVAVPGAVVDVAGTGRGVDEISTVRIATVARDFAHLGDRLGDAQLFGGWRARVDDVAEICEKRQWKTGDRKLGMENGPMGLAFHLWVLNSRFSIPGFPFSLNA